MLVAIVFACGLANGQQQAFDLSPPMRTEGTQNMMPPTSNHWQRDAMQMMQPPSQMSVSSAAPWPAPNNAYEVPMVASAAQPGLPRQANPKAHPLAGQTRQHLPSYLPPVHVSPPPRLNQAQAGYDLSTANQYNPRRPEQQSFDNSTPTKFTKKNGALSEFRRTQLSDRSLIPRGPGLQDRISELISSSRDQADDAQTQELELQLSRQQPRLRQPSLQQPRTQTPGMQRSVGSVEPTPLPFAMKVPPNARPLGEASRSSQPLVEDVRETRVKRLSEGRSRNEGGLGELRQQPTRQLEELPASVIEDLATEVPVTEYEVDTDVNQAAMSEPVLSQPIQDPFGDYPPLRSETPSYEHDRFARAQDRTDRPISVLNRPVRHRNEAPNQTFLPSNRSVDTYSVPDNEELIYESEPNVTFRDDSEFAPSDGDRYTEPSSERFYEYPEAQDGLDANLDQLEELPSLSGQDDQGKSDLAGDDVTGQAPVKRSCDEFRSRLLNNPITDIALDMSPPRSEQKKESKFQSRTWTDRGGNILATGTMTMLSRGYVVLDSGQKISRARLSDADMLAISEYWRIPEECSLGNEAFAARCWIPQTVTWKASSLCHKPLYFENVQLERYGHSHGPFLQPIQSTGHFFASLLFLPYQAGIHPANECQYVLGYYRPGDCAPWLKDPVPISLEGIKLQTLATVGLAYLP